MPRKGQQRDKNLDCEAVKKFRDVIHLQLNHVQRAEVAATVECNPRGLAIWEAVLTESMLMGRNPKNIIPMLKAWQLQYYG